MSVWLADKNGEGWWYSQAGNPCCVLNDEFLCVYRSKSSGRYKFLRRYIWSDGKPEYSFKSFATEADAKHAAEHPELDGPPPGYRPTARPKPMDISQVTNIDDL